MAGKIWAREIVRHAERCGIQIAYVGINNKRACARGVLSHMYTGEVGNMYDNDLGDKVGVTLEDIQALEDGFEHLTIRPESLKNKYYKVGQRVAKLANLPPKW